MVGGDRNRLAMQPLTPDAVRREQIAKLRDEPLDVLVIGGGFVGAGVARDAAMRGLRIGLVEKHDLAYGASSRSSRLLHGGLRYLAQGRLGLVYEASREKMVLHHIAPHLAEPLPFLFPTYRGDSWPRWKLAAGVKVYDLLCGRRNLGRSETLGPRAVEQLLPSIRRDKLTGAVRYFDGLTNDARLVLDTLGSAARHGAIVLNYAEFLDAAADGRGWRCGIRDCARRRRASSYGPQRRQRRGALGGGDPPQQTAAAADQGSTPGDRSAAVVVAQRRGDDGGTANPLWHTVGPAGNSRNDRYRLHGSTRGSGRRRGRYRVHPGNCQCEVSLGQSDSGRRDPHVGGLAAANRHGAGGAFRHLAAHQIHMAEPGWFDVAGGKLTTYRRIAQQVVDRIASYQGRNAGKCRTAIQPLLPPGQAAMQSGVLPPPVRADLVEHYCRREWAVHLDDVMIRRTSWHYYHPDAANIARETAGWMASALGWDAARQTAEIRRYLM